MARQTAKLLLDPRTGDRLVVLEEAAGSAGASFRFELRTNVVAEPPEDHVHGAQSERIEVLAGALCVRIGGRERVLRQGDRITIPAGTPHAVWNVGRGETCARGEFCPALDMQQRMEAQFRATLAHGVC